MGRLCVVGLLLAAAITFTSSKFAEWRHLDLIDPIEFAKNYRPGFKIQQTWVPNSCWDGRIPKVKSGDFVHQHYVGRLVDGTMFDSSYSRNSTYNFYLGTGVVITGMDMGMKGMCKGERRVITIPPSLGYGNRQVSSIPPNSKLIFEVILHDTWNGPTGHTVISKPANCIRKTAPGDLIRVHYNGSLSNGAPFWSTYEHSTLNFTVGEGNAIQGLDMNLLDMCEGEVRKIKVHHLLGYGRQGRGTTIPPNTDLVFDAELVEIVSGKLKYVKIDGPSCGSDKQVFRNDILEIEYSGESVTGKRGSNVGGRFKFQVGSEKVPKGLTWGVNSMCIGEGRRVLMPPEFVTADIDNAGFPLNRRLTLDIRLLSNNFGVAPTTLAPATPAPVTPAPVPPTQATSAPATLAPATPAPATPAPATPAPATLAPATLAPATLAPDTLAPATPAPATAAPATLAPDTLAPVTLAPATMAPDTLAPATLAPDTLAPDTLAPDTLAPATLAPATHAPDTLAPTTMAPDTLAPDTLAPDTVAPDTVAPDTLAPDTLAPDTLAPDTLAPTTKSKIHMPPVNMPTTTSKTIKPTTTRTTTIAPITQTPYATIPMIKVCAGKAPFYDYPLMDQWCLVNCNYDNPYCPVTHCVCL